MGDTENVQPGATSVPILSAKTVRGAVPRMDGVCAGTACPLCNTPLSACIGEWERVRYFAVECPNQCDLWEVYE